jgi:hypothetical protein
MPLVQTRGAASAQGFGEFSQPAGPTVNYIEDVFSTWLYTGNGTGQTITNGIDISGKGGMVWIKCRSAAEPPVIVDTVRGASNALRPSSTAASINDASRVSAFTTSGFTVGSNGETSSNGDRFASWTFREQAKFFDVVTYTGDGTSGRSIAHNLDSVPGCIIFKRTDSTSDWAVYHRGLNGGSGPEDYRIFLNTTSAQTTGPSYTISSLNSTTFTLGSNGTGGGSALTNVNGANYVAYLFAHNAGGFGTGGSDNVISCGTYTTDGSGNATINLGYEPQWLLTKWANAADNWHLFDDMRGFSVNTDGTSGNTNDLYPNSDSAEVNRSSDELFKTATGFNVRGSGASRSFIYIAIRRGPMKVPTTSTSIYQANTYTGNATANTTVAGNFGFPVDLMLLSSRSADSTGWSSYAQLTTDRLRGVDKILATAATTTDSNGWTTYQSFSVPNNIGWGLYGTSSGTGYLNNAGGTFVARGFKRAPGFFDEVCYTGTGSTTTITHNLGVVPELVITKSRSQALGWVVWTTSLPSTNSWIRLDTNDSIINSPVGYGGPFLANTYQIINTGPFNALNNSGSAYVAYLFATLAGISKVGSYTGTGTTQTINCGFTAGSRFVMIKRTDSTGDWYVWDSARGIVAGNDPYLLLNSASAEVTNTDFIDTDSSGFEISSTAPAAINANGGTFIFLAIA